MKRSGGITFVAAILIYLFAIGVQADALNDALDTPVSLTLEDAHLKDVLQAVNAQCNINIVVDNRVIPMPGVGASTEHYVTDGKIPYVNLKEVAIRDVLTVVLTPLGLGYSVQDKYVWISSPELIKQEVSEKLETRIYIIDDKLVEERNAILRKAEMSEIDLDSLVMFLSAAFPRIVEPVTHELVSYARFNLLTKQLVIHNTPANHAKIKEILDLLFKSVESVGPAEPAPSA